MPYSRHLNSKYTYDPSGATSHFKDALHSKEVDQAVDDLVDELIAHIKVAIPQKKGLAGGSNTPRSSGTGWLSNWWNRVNKMAELQRRRDARKRGAHIGNPEDLDNHYAWEPGQGVVRRESIMPLEVYQLIQGVINEEHGLSGGDDSMSSYEGETWRARLNNPVMQLGTYLRGEFKNKIKALIQHYAGGDATGETPEDQPPPDQPPEPSLNDEPATSVQTPDEPDAPEEAPKPDKNKYYYKTIADYKEAIEKMRTPREKAAAILRDKKWLDPTVFNDDQVKMVNALYKAYEATHPVLSGSQADEETSQKAMDEVKASIERDIENGIRPRASSEIMDHVSYYQLKLKEQTLKNYTTPAVKSYAKKLPHNEKVDYYKNLLKD